MNRSPKEVVADVLGRTTIRMASKYSPLPGARERPMEETVGAE